MESDKTCNCCGSEKKLWQNHEGKYLWLFSWEESGGNDVWAHTREDAIAEIAAQFSGLAPALQTLRRCTYEEYQAHNRALWMMTI